jgi:hypothetical protein
MRITSDTIKAHCNRCGGENNQAVLHQLQDEWNQNLGTPEAPGPIQHGFDNYAVLRCRGCDSVSFRHESWCNDYGDEVFVSFYPPTRRRDLPQWVNGMDSLRFSMSQTFVPSLLGQIYSAFHAGSFAIAAMGIRALVEQMIIDKVGDKGSFGANLDAFAQAGYLSKVQRASLEATLELGHAAIHRGYEPSADDVRRALDISEPLLETVYIHEGHAEQLEKTVPKRKPKGSP